MALASSAYTDEELNMTKAADMTPEMASAALDWAIANTNTGKIAAIAESKKVDLGDIVEKTAGKINAEAAFFVLKARQDVTNHTYVAKYLQGIDLKSESNFWLSNLFRFHDYHITADGFAWLKQVCATDIVTGALIASDGCYDKTKRSQEFNAFTDEAVAKAAEVAQAEVNDSYTMLAFIRYACNVNHDFSMFSAFYKKDLMPACAKTMTWFNMRCRFKEAADFNAELASQLLAIHKDSLAFTYMKDADKCFGNRDTTAKAYGFIADASVRFQAAMYLDDPDKIIDALVKCDSTLTTAQIDSALAALNSLDPDYKSAEVLRALKAVNQRYTLKLYDDRDTWEPVISKVRAMIDCRK